MCGVTVMIPVILTEISGVSWRNDLFPNTWAPAIRAHLMAPWMFPGDPRDAFEYGTDDHLSQVDHPAGDALENEPEPPLFRLLGDVPPGATSEGAIMLAPPRGGPGLRTLEVRLMQDGSPTPIATLRERLQVGGTAVGAHSGGDAQKMAPAL